CGPLHATTSVIHSVRILGSRAMKTTVVWLLLTLLMAAPTASAQDLSRYSDEGLQKELASIADAETAVLVPMRDGIGLSTNISRPKNATGDVPTILWKTPY